MNDELILGCLPADGMLAAHFNQLGFRHVPMAAPLRSYRSFTASESSPDRPELARCFRPSMPALTVAIQGTADNAAPALDIAPNPIRALPRGAKRASLPFRAALTHDRFGNRGDGLLDLASKPCSLAQIGLERFIQRRRGFATVRALPTRGTAEAASRSRAGHRATALGAFASFRHVTLPDFNAVSEIGHYQPLFAASNTSPKGLVWSTLSKTPICARPVDTPRPPAGSVRG